MNRFIGKIREYLRPPQAVEDELQDDEYDDDDDEQEDEQEPLPPAAVRRRPRPTALVPYSPTEDIYLEKTAGTHGKMTDIIIYWAAIIGTPILWFILGLGNAQLFSGFKAFSFYGPTFLAYLGGFVYEGMGIALILFAGREFAKKNYLVFVVVMLFAVFMSMGSFFSQYALLQAEMLNNSLGITDQVLAGLPFGGATHVTVFMMRAAFPNLLEFAIVFLFAERQVDAIETLKKKQKVQEQYQHFQEGEAVLQQKALMHQTTMQLMQTIGDKFAENIDIYNQSGVIQQPPQIVYIEKDAATLQATSIQQVQQPIAKNPVTQHPTRQPAPSVQPPQRPIQRATSDTPDIPSMVTRPMPPAGTRPVGPPIPVKNYQRQPAPQKMPPLPPNVTPLHTVGQSDALDLESLLQQVEGEDGASATK